jgi:hypothetical protein
MAASICANISGYFERVGFSARQSAFCTDLRAFDILPATGHQSMIPKKPAPNLIRGSCSNN